MRSTAQACDGGSLACLHVAGVTATHGEEVSLPVSVRLPFTYMQQRWLQEASTGIWGKMLSQFHTLFVSQGRAAQQPAKHIPLGQEALGVRPPPVGPAALVLATARRKAGARALPVPMLRDMPAPVLKEPPLPPSSFAVRHLRAIVYVNGVRLEAVVDTGADISLISAHALPAGVAVRPWTPQDGHIYGVAHQNVTVLGRVVVQLRMGPLTERVPLLVVLGVAFDAILGVDFLCEYDIAIQPLRHHLILQGHADAVYPLLGPSPQFTHAGRLSHEVAIFPNARMMARVCVNGPAGMTYFVARCWDKSLGLFVPDQAVKTNVELRNFSDNLIYLPQGWPLGRFLPLQEAVSKGPSPPAPSGPRDPTGLGIMNVCVVVSGCPVLRVSTVESKPSGEAPPAASRVSGCTTGPVSLGDAGPPSTPGVSSRELSSSAGKFNFEGQQPTYQKTQAGNFVPTLPSPNSCLTAAEVATLKRLLFAFQDRFNDGSKPLTATNLLKARLDTGTAPPVSFPPRRLSPAMREVVRKAVAELDEKGITEPGVGCWGSPIVMVKKASGAWRLCCDYREVNKHVIIPQQPLPRTDDILASFHNKRYFSVIDMCHGFYQIEIEEQSA